MNFHEFPEQQPGARTPFLLKNLSEAFLSVRRQTAYFVHNIIVTVRNETLTTDWNELKSDSRADSTYRSGSITTVSRRLAYALPQNPCPSLWQSVYGIRRRHCKSSLGRTLLMYDNLPPTMFTSRSTMLGSTVRRLGRNCWRARLASIMSRSDIEIV